MMLSGRVPPRMETTLLAPGAMWMPGGEAVKPPDAAGGEVGSESEPLQEGSMMAIKRIAHHNICFIFLRCLQQQMESTPEVDSIVSVRPYQRIYDLDTCMAPWRYFQSEVQEICHRNRRRHC